MSLGSPNASRISRTHFVSESSETKVSGHAARNRSSFVTSRPRCSWRWARTWNVFALSLISRPSRSRHSRSRLIVTSGADSLPKSEFFPRSFRMWSGHSARQFPIVRASIIGEVRDGTLEAGSALRSDGRGAIRNTGERLGSRRKSVAETAHAGRRLFDQETFAATAAPVSPATASRPARCPPEAARRRFRINPHEPLFTHDGSDDEDGDGFGDDSLATRMLTDATILMRIPLHPHLTLKRNPEAHGS